MPTQFIILFVKNLSSKVCKNTAIGAAILCPSVCTSDVMSNERVCGKSFKYRTNQIFLLLLFVRKEFTNTAAPCGAQMRSKKSVFFFCIIVIKIINAFLMRRIPL